jgi:hypothetical protein
MTTWTTDELARIGEAEELQVSSRRPDGSARPYVTIWVVRVSDELFIRSAYGPGNPWFRRAQRSGVGRIRAGGVEREVRFTEPEPSAHPAIDDAYHAKYDRHGARVVGTVVGDRVVETTFRLEPTDQAVASDAAGGRS